MAAAAGGDELGAGEHAQRGGGKEYVAYPRLPDDALAFLGVELGHARSHNRHTKRQSRHQNVKQTSNPGPVGRRPETIPFLPQKTTEQLCPRHMARQHTVAVQCPLGTAGCTTGIDQNRRILGACLGHLKRTRFKVGLFRNKRGDL